MTNECDLGGCCSLPTERADCASVRKRQRCSPRLASAWGFSFVRSLRLD